MAAPMATCFISNPQGLHCCVSPMEAASSFLNKPMYRLFLFLFLTLSLLSLSLLFRSLYRRIRRMEEELRSQTLDESSVSALKVSLSKLTDEKLKTQKPHSTHFDQSLLVELLPSNSPEWASLFSPVAGFDDLKSGLDEEGGGNNVEEGEVKKKKKKRKKKKKQGISDSLANLKFDGRVDGRSVEEEFGGKNKELPCLYPFTSSSSATQRKIKQQYDELVRSHGTKGLTLEQVGQFVNCLVDARNELKHKSEVIKRKYTITKALLLRPNRSSFDRLQQQMCSLELEQKRLEEDALVYNWLQYQLKLSPAYKKMLEMSDSMELSAKSPEVVENPDYESTDISFEELLAQEKKDSFWQKHGKLRSSCS
ncbi:hypothetical protein Dimus_004156 [Dionaea muscipula]